MRITLVLTHRCNLACTYCYAGEKFNRRMTLKTGCQALQMAFAKAAPGEPITVSFFGGEPMLEFSLLTRLTRLAHRLGMRQQRPVRFDITTNGTMLSERHLRFLYTYDFDVAISVDGVGPGNQERPFVSGQSSAPLVWENIAWAASWLEKLTVMMVVTAPSLVYLDESVRHLHALGVHRIVLLPEVSRPWSETAWHEMGLVFEELARVCQESLDTDRPLSLHPFVDRFRPSRGAAPCGFGDTSISVSPAGNLYPCARLVGTDTRRDVQVGDVRRGVNAERVRQVQGLSQGRLNGCGVDSPCGCVPLMPGNVPRQLAQYRRFGQIVDAAVAAAELVLV